ncbi:MAG: MFS transporter [Candidatus Kerfeldbacteria bacterium]|nr:MFS transporter [Candidatus Kerfeldbacteria bacterium]
MQQLHTSQVFSRVVRATPTALLNVIIALGIYNFGWGFADPFFSQFLRTFSDHYTVIGLLAAVINAITIVMVIPVGGLLERISRRQVLDIGRLGYVCVGVLYVCAGAFHSLPLLVVALMCNGFFLPFVWTSVIATVESESTKENASMMYGFYTTMRQLLWALGLLCALCLLPYIPLYGLFIPVIIFPLISFWYSRKLPDPQERASAARIASILLSPWMLLRSFYRDALQFPRELWIAYTIHFFVHMIYTATIIFLPLYVVSQGHPMFLAGVLAFILTIPFIMSMLSSGLPQAAEHWRMAAVGVAIFTVGFFGLSFFHTSFQAIAFWGLCVMCGYACVIPALGGIITATTPRPVIGTSSAMVDITEFGAALVAAPTIGFVIDTFSWQNFFFSITVYCGMLTLAVIAIRRAFRLADIRFMHRHPHMNKRPYVL